MVRLECFSVEVCQKLLDAGYSHFVIRAGDGKDEMDEGAEVHTLEAVRGGASQASIPIMRFMRQQHTARYYILVRAGQLV